VTGGSEQNVVPVWQNKAVENGRDAMTAQRLCQQEKSFDINDLPRV